MGRSIVLVLLLAHAARADEIPIVTLSDVGANQDVPVHRSFFIAGDAPSGVQSVQALVVRKGSPGMFGDDGGDCRSVIADLRVESVIESGGDDDDDTPGDDDAQAVVKYPAGVHEAFELFPRASGSRDSAVLVTAPWKRSSPEARDYKVFVPHDADFFAPGYGYCLAIVTTERAQALDDATLAEMVDTVAHKLVACGDKSSCDDDALADHEARAAKTLPKQVAAHMKDIARAELAGTTSLIEALDHLRERWHDKTAVLAPGSGTVWGATASDPFAGAVATMLSRNAGLLPQVRGKEVALFTTDGKLEVRTLQLLDDGRSIRVAPSASPAAARVLTATTDTLAVTDGITLFDLIQLGQGKLRVDKEWTTLSALGDKAAAVGSESWSTEDAAYLASANEHLRRLANFVDNVTTGASCTGSPQEGDVVRKLLGQWLVCQHVDAGALEALVEQLDELQGADAAWKAAKDKVLARDKALVTLTTTSVIDARAERAPRTWLFSYVTPVAGYAGILRPDESFGLFYLGAEIHLAPNPVDEIQWKRGSQDLLRAIALELAIAPYGGSFGPEHRYGGLGALPPVFVGVAFHAIPYTSVTVGGAFLERRNSTIPEERTHTTFAPYVGLALQLNLPDLLYQAVTR
ncbi:MAG: hypothetical protein JO257_02240 [Deltaproteobacteria bacterium]|nr:hypothetical protein [Deltaproteobacteria bacterium]